MKNKILNYCINSIKEKSDKKYNDIQLAEIRYGLEALYLTFSKLIVILIVALVLGIFKQMITVLLLYNLLRLTGFGIHAKKSWMCLVSSLTIFIGCPYLALNITIPFVLKILVCGFCVISFYLYAPADTEKHPLIKKKKRNAYKFLTVITSLIYTFICLYTNNIFLSNAIICALVIEMLMVHPLVYRIFKLPYNNYKRYILQNT